MKTKLLTCLLYFYVLNTTEAQKTLTASAIDMWPKKEVVDVPITYNRVSSYLYILNAQKYLDMFDGKKFTPDERRRLGIKSGDRPDFLQMSISITDPSISKEALTVPLLLVNLRNEQNFNTFKSFKGPILDNLNINDINREIMGSIEVNAMISNASAKFWSEVAKITSDLGKSAITIAIGNPRGATDLTSKLTDYINRGINDLGKLSNGEKLDKYIFSLPLINRPNDLVIEELVTFVKVYQIHWLGEAVKESDYFGSVKTYDKISTAGFETRVLNKEVPIVLVIETRSRTKILVGNPVFTEDYKKYTMDEYKSYPIEDQIVLRDYYLNFTYAYSAFNYLKNYNTSVAKNSTDWNSLLFAIENTYLFRLKVKKEREKYSGQGFELFKKQFDAVDKRYVIINRQLNDIYSNIENRNAQLENANALISALINPIPINSSKENLYKEIKKLAFYDIWISSISADGSTLKTSSSYMKSLELKKVYGIELNKQLTQDVPVSDDLKFDFYDRIKADYSACEECVFKASKQTADIKLRTLESLINSYKELKTAQFKEFNECSVLIRSKIPSMKDSISFSEELTKRLASSSLLDLESNLKLWTDNITKDTSTATIEQLGIWTITVSETRKKMKQDIADLVNMKIITAENFPCQ